MKKRKVFIIIDLVLILAFLFGYVYFKSPNIYKVDIDNKLTDDNKILLSVYVRKPKKLKMSCSIDNKEWNIIENGKCTFNVDNGMHFLRIKDDKGKIYKKEININVNKVIDIIINTNTLYLPINGEKEIKASIKSIGDIKSELNYEVLDKEVASFDNGKIKGIKEGSTKLAVSIDGIKKEVNIVVTRLLQNMHIDNNKKLIQCGEFNESDEELINIMMKSRAEEAGFPSRGSVVAVARFISMEFSRRIPYFPENGRLPYVDGEGRYYHTGVYLTESNYDKLSKIRKGPKPWGCKIYTTYASKYMQNGLDCSGYISWVLLNGGFDVGDVGAGVTGATDLTDYGEKRRLDYDVLDEIKVGDLLNSNLGGGHIALILGFDGEKYYVTEELWDSKNYGALVMTYTKQQLINNYLYVVLMDKYYKADGIYTNMW